jgi:hypothetical protein
MRNNSVQLEKYHKKSDRNKKKQKQKVKPYVLR